MNGQDVAISIDDAAPQQVGGKHTQVSLTGESKAIAIEVRRTEDASGASGAEVTIKAEQRFAHAQIKHKDGGDVEVSYILYRSYVSLTYQVKDLSPFEELEQTKKERCIDCCCQAYSCLELFRCNRTQDSRVSVKEESVLSPSLQRARTVGIKQLFDKVTDFGTTIYTGTPLGSTVKVISITSSLLFSLGLLINGIVTFALFDRNSDNSKGVKVTLMIGELVFSSLALLFTFVDVIFYIKLNGCCKVCNECKKFHHDVQNYKEETDADLKTSCYETAKKNKEEIESLGETEPEEHDKCKQACTCCPSCLTLGMDVARVFLLDLMFYPLLLMSIFMLLTEIILDQITITAYIQFGLSALSKFFGVYIIRAFILGGTLFSVQRVRRANLNKKLKGSSYHFLFVFNCYGQMIVQMLMIAAIGARFYYEFNECIHDTSMPPDPPVTCTRFTPSGQLNYMMWYGYCAPVFGIIMFLFMNHFWTQKFPIKFLINFLKALKQKDNILDAKKSITNFEKKLENIVDDKFGGHLSDEYKKWNNLDFMSKLVYPFTSPAHVVISVIYSAFLMAFVFSAAINGFDTLPWIIFYLTATAFAALVNGYACIVAVFWITILVGIIIVIALIILACFLGSLGGDSSSNRR